MLMLRGFSLPHTPEGKSSLVPAPPWHYVANALGIEFEADADAVAAFLPDGAEPSGGRCAVYFYDWQTSTDDDPTYLDPIRSQYREAFILVSATYKGKPLGYCPYIWVDNDVAMIRGHIQGWPKQMGSIYMTREYGVPSKAAPVVGPGGQFGASCAAKDHRIITAQITLREISDAPPNPGFTGFLNRLIFPDLREGMQNKLLLDNIVEGTTNNDMIFSPIWKGDAVLQINDGYYTELKAFKPKKVVAGYSFSMSHTLVDQSLAMVGTK